MTFIRHLKDRVNSNALSGSTLKNYYFAVKLFYQANDIQLNWKWIQRGLPPASTVANDRIPSLEEIRKIIEYSDRRIKLIIYVMISSGIRVESWEHLKWKHITPIKNEKTGQVVAAKILAYNTENAKPHYYTTFITPEAYAELETIKNLECNMKGERI